MPRKSRVSTDISNGKALPPLKDNHGAQFIKAVMVISAMGLFFASLLVFLILQDPAATNQRFLVSLFFLILTFLTVPLAAQSFRTIVESFYPSLGEFIESDAQSLLVERYELRIQTLYDFRNIILLSIPLTILAVFSVSRLDFGASPDTQRVLFYCAYVAFACLPAVGVSITYGLYELFKHLAELMLNQDPFTSVRSLAGLTSKLAGLYLGFVFFTSAVILSNPDARSNPFIIVATPLLESLPAVALVYSTWCIHEAMLNRKKKVITDLTRHLTKAFGELNENPSPQRIAHFRDIEQLAQQFETLPEWPYDLKGFLSLIGAPILPIFLVVLPRLLDLIKSPGK